MGLPWLAGGWRCTISPGPRALLPGHPILCRPRAEMASGSASNPGVCGRVKGEPRVGRTSQLRLRKIKNCVLWRAKRAASRTERTAETRSNNHGLASDHGCRGCGANDQLAP